LAGAVGVVNLAEGTLQGRWAATAHRSDVDWNTPQQQVAETYQLNGRCCSTQYADPNC
jgi:hypothetical protein